MPDFTNETYRYGDCIIIYHSSACKIIEVKLTSVNEYIEIKKKPLSICLAQFRWAQNSV